MSQSSTAPMPSAERLDGRTALVTGGSRGIGRAIAERLGRERARVGVHFGSDAAAAIEAAGGEAFTLQVRLGDPGDAEALWEAFDSQANGLDILVNNAGINGGRTHLTEVTPESFDRLFDTTRRRPSSSPSRACPDCGTVAGSSTSRPA